jgi:hypothetical protein
MLSLSSHKDPDTILKKNGGKWYQESVAAYSLPSREFRLILISLRSGGLGLVSLSPSREKTAGFSRYMPLQK